MNNKNDVYKRMEELGIELPPVLSDPPTLKLVRPLADGLLYLSGMGPALIGQEEIHGKLLDGCDEETGYLAAQNVILNALAVLHQYLGDLNRITDFVKMICFVACKPEFERQPQVANGASDLLISIFGEDIGKSARSAVGVAALPGNIPIEIEMIVRYK